MEYIDGAQVNDVKTMKKLGIQPQEVARLVSETFAEMMFKHGFVHCDPHAANLIVRPLPSSRRSILGKRKPQLVLLDHGLYKELDDETRTNYAALRKALIFSDGNAIKKHSAKLGAGEDLYALFAGILTMRPWNRVIGTSVDHLVIRGNDSDRSELQLQEPSLETFMIVGRISSEAIIEAKLQKRSFLSWLSAWLDKFRLEARLFIMRIALWLLRVRKVYLQLVLK